MVDLIPILIFSWFIYFYKTNGLNSFLTGLIFVSFFIFATNYTHFGFDIPFFRYLHRLIGVAAGIFLLIFIFRYKSFFLKEYVPIFMALFFSSILLSYVGNELNFKSYFHYARNYIFISTIVLYLYFYIDNKNKLEEIFKLIASITLMLSLFLILEKSLLGFWDWGYRSDLFYPNPNYLAFAMLPGLAIQIFHIEKYSWLKSLFMIIGIVLTLSISAIISTIFIVFVFFIYKKYYFVTVGFLILTLIFSSYAILKNSKNISDARLIIPKIVFNMFNESPINGIGYGQFLTKFPLYVDKEIYKQAPSEILDLLVPYYYQFGYSASVGFNKFKIVDEYSDGNSVSLERVNPYSSTRLPEKMTHNDLLTIMAELGLVGLIILVFFLYRVFALLKKILVFNREYYYVSISMMGGSLIFSLFHNNLTSFMFWFVLFTPFIIIRNYENNLDH